MNNRLSLRLTMVKGEHDIETKVGLIGLPGMTQRLHLSASQDEFRRRGKDPKPNPLLFVSCHRGAEEAAKVPLERTQGYQAGTILT